MERIHGPFVGPRRADLRAAQIAAMVLNVNREAGKPSVDFDDIALEFSPVEELSPEQEREQTRAIFGVRSPE